MTLEDVDQGISLSVLRFVLGSDDIYAMIP